jgi:putative ABC transport system permease protein
VYRGKVRYSAALFGEPIKLRTSAAAERISFLKPPMPSLSKHLKYVVRRLTRTPMFTAVTLITLGIGVGANTAIFSVINGILLKPLPYPDSERLVSVWQSAPGIGLEDVNASPSDYFTFREENHTFQSFGVWTGGSVSITGLGAPEQVQTLTMSEGTLNALGVQPALGRWFTAKDDSPDIPRTAILTYGYWQRRFGADAAAIGRQIRVDGQLTEIIGVMPRGFRFLDEKPDLIVPFQFNRAKTTLGNFSYQAVARLKQGVTLAQANADVARMIPIVNTKFPPPPGFSAKIFENVRILPKVRPLKQDVVGDLGKVLWVLMGSIGVVLLIACANVANLLLVRAEGRQQELAIRTALGAGSRQIAGELLTESVFLGVLGGVAGLGFAYAALRLLVRIAPASLPRIESITMDPLVLLFTFAISLLAGLLFGLIPVIKYAAPNVTAALRAGGRTLSQSRERHRAHNTLVVLQTALAVVLLVSSGLMIRTFQALRHVPPGFANPEQLQTIAFTIPDAQVKEPERVIQMFREVERKISEIPSVRSVAFANAVPTDGNNSTDLLYVEDRTYTEGQLPPLRRFKFVTPGFFQTMGIRLIAGRDYTWTDIRDKREVTIISENMARELWHDPARAISKRIREGMKDSWREIIGVVGDVHHDGADQKAPTVVYWPLIASNFWGNATFVERRAVYAIRTSRAGSESLLKQVREAVWSVNKEVPLASVRTMAEIYRGSMARSSFTLVMLAIAGGMALLLGIVGIYGVISYSVSQRTREIGIRIALGAQQSALKTMVVRHGLLLSGVGVVLGLSVAAALTRILSSFLFQISPFDPVTYVSVSAVLLGAAALASYVPAHRASAVNPADALRVE